MARKCSAHSCSVLVLPSAGPGSAVPFMGLPSDFVPRRFVCLLPQEPRLTMSHRWRSGQGPGPSAHASAPPLPRASECLAARRSLACRTAIACSAGSLAVAYFYLTVAAAAMPRVCDGAQAPTSTLRSQHMCKSEEASRGQACPRPRLRGSLRVKFKLKL